VISKENNETTENFKLKVDTVLVHLLATFLEPRAIFYHSFSQNICMLLDVSEQNFIKPASFWTNL